MGVTGGVYMLIIDPVEKIRTELLEQAKQAKSTDQKFLRKIATQLNRDVLRTLTTLGSPPNNSIYNWLAAIYLQISGQQAPANGSPTYEDLITLEYSILGALESVAQTKNKFPQLDAKTIGQNHRVLVYLEAIFNILSNLAQFTFTASVSPTIESQLSSPHHLAVAGYLDACGKAVAEWKKGTYTPPPDSNNISDANWFPLYLKQIYIAFPPTS